MTDNPAKRGSPDNDLVSLEQPHETTRWAKRFGVSEQKLREAVGEVGHSVRKIEAYLKRKAS